MVAVKKTYIKLILRGIRGSLNRFLSILAIVAIGAGFLAGLLATTPDMQATVDQYWDEKNGYDINIKGTMGLTDEDVAVLNAEEGIDAVMPAYVTDTVVMNGRETAMLPVFMVQICKANRP